MNPENKCSHLINNKIDKIPTIQEMFALQRKLQDTLALKNRAIDYNTASFKEHVDDITIQWRNLTTEFAELIERLPFKEWRTYAEEDLSGFRSEDERLETLFEYIDMWHFFMNIGLALGIDGDTFAKLYALKNQENLDRQKRGY